MAYSAPTVATDPTTLAQAGTALTTLNGYVTGLYTDANALLALVREHVRLRQGNQATLEALDRLGATLGTPGNTALVAVTDPVTLADGDSIFAAHVAYLDLFTARFANAYGFIRSALKLAGGLGQMQPDIDAKLTTFVTATVAVTTAGSDPVSAAHMNTALAAATARVDTINGRLAPIVDLLLQEFRLVGGNPLAMATIANIGNVIRGH